MDSQELNETTRTAMPFAALLGVEVVAADPEEVRARLEWDESRCTAGGILHGGALMGLADAAGGLCAFLNLPEGAAATATIESKTQLLPPRLATAMSRRSHVSCTRAGRRSSSRRSSPTPPAARAAKVTQTQASLGG